MCMFQILVINNSKLRINKKKHDLQHFNFMNTCKHYWKANNTDALKKFSLRTAILNKTKVDDFFLLFLLFSQ